jgi:predicted O-methyltransferase YrrM
MTKGVSFKDKFLPTQIEYRHDYVGAAYEHDLYDAILHASGIGAPQDDFVLEQTDMFSQEEMGSNPIGLRLLEFLISANNAKRVLEIGTFIGAASMVMARALPDDGQVVTIEKFDHFAAIARRNFERNGLARKIELLEGDAFEAIEGLPTDKPFDLIFIDGNKERYRHYMEVCLPLLAPNGIMAVDDCFFHGDAVNSVPTNDKGRGCKEALDFSANLDNWVRLALPISNGILVLKRK